MPKDGSKRMSNLSYQVQLSQKFEGRSNFDALIHKLYPDLEEYRSKRERDILNFTDSLDLQPLQESFSEGLQRQKGKKRLRVNSKTNSRKFHARSRMDVAEPSIPPRVTSKVVSFWLLRHPNEHTLPNLKMPFCSLAGDATVSVLLCYLTKKMGFSTPFLIQVAVIAEDYLQIILFEGCQIIQFIIPNLCPIS